MSDYEPAGLEARENADGLAYEEWRDRIREDDTDEREGETMTATQAQKDRLEYLRGELRAERISYGELAELQDLAGHIAADDVELLEAAGVPEFDEGAECENAARELGEGDDS